MHYVYPDAKLLVFAKAPVAGQVKTRLIPDYSPEQAAQIHANLVHHTLKMVTDAQLCPIELWCAPYTDHPFFEACQQQYPITLQQQQGDDLGERMFNAFEAALKTSKHVVLIGTDCPALRKENLDQALQALHHRHDIAISPATDGGYVLIALSKIDKLLFEDISWGSDEVMMQTLQHIQQLNYQFAPLEPHSDIDYASDLQNLDPPVREKLLCRYHLSTPVSSKS